VHEATKSNHNWKLIFVLGILSAYGPLTIDLYMPALPTLATSFNTHRIQQTMAAYFLGLSLGQLFMGPLSDRIGRKKPLLIGCILYSLASLGCALAFNINSLIGFRFLQALGGCVGMVLATSIVRDLFPVKDSAKVFSYLMLVMGLAPILAPLVGGQILLYSSWRMIFTTLAVFGVLCFFLVAFSLPESLPKEKRNQNPLWMTFHDYLRLIKDSRFTRYVLPNSLMGAGFFTYLSGAAMVFITVYGVSAQHFGFIFALNAIGLIGCSQLNTVLLNHFDEKRILKTAMIGLSICSLLLWIIAYTNFGGMLGLWIALFVCIGGMGFIRPNAVAATMAPFGKSAGSASSLMSALGSVAGSLSGVLLSLFSTQSALPMVSVIAINYIVALCLFLLLQSINAEQGTDGI
jgi:DHA1 family bicyclomycin/chloramphenicol resistance-like MFS transporter